MKTFKEYIAEGLFDTSNSRNKPRSTKPKNPLKNSFNKGFKAGQKAGAAVGAGISKVASLPVAVGKKALGATAKIGGGIVKGVKKLDKVSRTDVGTSQGFQSNSSYKQGVKQRQNIRHQRSLQNKRSKNLS